MISAFGVDHGRETVSKVSERTKTTAAAVGGGAAGALGGAHAGVTVGGKMASRRIKVVHAQGRLYGFEDAGRGIGTIIQGAKTGAKIGAVGGAVAGGVGYKKLKQRQKKKVSKAYGRGPAMDAARWTAGIAGAGGAGGGATMAVERRKGAKRRDAEHVAAAGVLGGGAAQGAYQVAGYQAKYSAARAEAKSGLTRAKKDKKLKAVKRRHGAFTAGMYRNYPKDLPGAKTHRVLGYTHRGKTGTALGTAVTLAGAAGAIKATKKAKEKS